MVSIVKKRNALYILQYWLNYDYVQYFGILHVYTWIVEYQDVNENVPHVDHLNIKSPLLSVEGYHHVTQCLSM